MIVVGLTGGIGAGKSTVSSMLAERGAAIVDADQIAKDLQSAGSPVLAAMAERFGEHIIRDDGELDRAAVAKIVFSDEQALKDLNGIVHPAMQAEIQRQIDEHRDTDRVVVLDFPLLGENPRRGLAATIVVDVPYDLAVERAVGRGMDEDDVRNRIDSQIGREQRLERATHVVDNSGDLIDLVAAVDRLWAELVELSPTDAAAASGDGASDGAESDRPSDAGATPDHTPPSRTCWVFGYGSLVSPTSMARTIARHAEPGADFFEADLAGYGRRWNYGIGHVTGTWDRADGTTVDSGVLVALGLVESPGETVNGVIATLTDAELARLDDRERHYDRVDVSHLVTTTIDLDLPVYTYVPRPVAVARYEEGRDSGTAGIRSTYWDLVDEAFAALGDEQLERFRATTPPPDIPVVELLDTHTRTA